MHSCSLEAKIKMNLGLCNRFFHFLTFLVVLILILISFGFSDAQVVEQAAEAKKPERCVFFHLLLPNFLYLCSLTFGFALIDLIFFNLFFKCVGRSPNLKSLWQKRLKLGRGRKSRILTCLSVLPQLSLSSCKDYFAC